MPRYLSAKIGVATPSDVTSIRRAVARRGAARRVRFREPLVNFSRGRSLKETGEVRRERQRETKEKTSYTPRERRGQKMNSRPMTFLPRGREDGRERVSGGERWEGNERRGESEREDKENERAGRGAERALGKTPLVDRALDDCLAFRSSEGARGRSKALQKSPGTSGDRPAVPVFKLVSPPLLLLPSSTSSPSPPLSSSPSCRASALTRSPSSPTLRQPSARAETRSVFPPRRDSREAGRAERTRGV